MADPFILALDQGTTSSRTIVFNEAGHAVVTAQSPTTQIFPHPGWVNQDATEARSVAGKQAAPVSAARDRPSL